MIIFDSRKASDVYEFENYYRGSNFTVGPNQQAMLELTTNKSYYEKIEFFIVRSVEPSNDKCYETDCLEKALRCAGEYVTLGGMREWLVVDRPGQYYIVANKGSCGDQLSDCKNPTIVEVAIENKCC